MNIATHSFPNVTVDAAMGYGEHTSMPAAIRYVLADGDFLARRGVEAVLEPEPRLHLVGTCSSREALPGLVAATGPAVVVTDAWLPADGEGGLEFACGLRDHVPRIGLVVLSRSVDPTYGAALLESGLESRAYLLKERAAEPGRLADAICEVAAGRSVVDPQVVDGVFDAMRPPAGSPIDELTAREREVLALMATGLSNGAIAAELWLTKRAVEKHVNSIFATLHLSDEAHTARRVAAALAFIDASHPLRIGTRPGGVPGRRPARPADLVAI